MFSGDFFSKPHFSLKLGVLGIWDEVHLSLIEDDEIFYQLLPNRQAGARSMLERQSLTAQNRTISAIVRRNALIYLKVCFSSKF